jgi:general stress protein 26
MDVASFADIEAEFTNRVRRIVWCTVATVNQAGRPTSRILHPIWEGSTGSIATARNSVKAKHIRGNPFVSLCYWDQQHEQIYAECKAEWDDRLAEKQRVWDLFKNTPPPLGYDPAMFWPAGPGDPTFGALKLTPWRIELSALSDLFSGTPPKVWRQPV